MSVQAMKRTLRQSIIAGRVALLPNERTRLSEEISRSIRELDGYFRSRTVLGYLNFGAEFESARWVHQALADGKRVLLPRVNPATRQLDLFQVSDLETQLEVGSYGIREPIPTHCRAGDLAEIDFVLLPGVGFGRDGARLGYGGGFYDKLLARITHKPVLAAAAFSLQVVEGIPQEPTDRKVDWLVTEHETIHCAAGRAGASGLLLER